jgi:predicted CopG family antitoxin
MSDRKQTRRSISISGPTYAKLKAHCEEKGCSMSSVVERLLKESLPSNVNLNRVEKIREVAQKKASGQEGGIFTF